MTWLAKPPLTRILKGVAAAWLLTTLPVFTAPAHANNWGEMAMVSETMGVFDSRICIGEASRGDLGCPTYSPTISSTGRINAAAGLTVNTVSLTTTGTTWGYLGSGASYLPNLSSNAISATNISATTINGIAVSALGSNSGTVVSGTTSMVSGWPDAFVCTLQGVAYTRYYYLSESPGGGNNYYIYRSFEFGVSSNLVHNSFRYNTDGTFFDFSSSNGNYTGGGTCANKSISQLYAEGKAFNFIGNSGAGGGALGDRLTSGTLAVTANSATAIVSLSTNGTTWGYLGSNASYLPTLNTSAISATAVQISSNTAVTCGAGNAGTLRYNNSNTALELCTGSGWQVMGVGIPAGTISAFASTTCPTGWSEYTPARGRFLRGIDNGAGNDPGGTRAPGNIQGDALSNHSHRGVVDYSEFNSGTFNSPVVSNTGSSNRHPYQGDTLNKNIQTEAISFGSTSIANETRPKNVAVTFCQFNGTSNGWNNPLSGGSTVPGGNTGQIQFNSAGAFAGSTGLTWDNAASRLTATNISATAFVGDGSGLTNVTATNANTLDGLDSTAFVLKSGSTMTGTLQVPYLNVAAQGVEGGEIQLLKGTGQSNLAGNVVFDTASDLVRFYEAGGSYRQFNFNLVNGALSGPAGTFWHTGNDGAGSGLDADTLDGVDSGGFMRREVNTWHASNEGAARFFFASGGRTYIRANNGDGAIVSFRGGDEVDKVHIGQDGNIWMAWLGDWMSNRLGQDVRSGASPTFSNIFASNATLTGNVTAGAFLYSSDAALKKNIAVSPGLEILRELRGVTFDWKANGKHASGVIAQEVEKVMPHAVKTGHEGTKLVDYLQLIAPLIEAAKELKTENDALKAQMDAHDRALRAANDNLARLEQEIQALKQSR